MVGTAIGHVVTGDGRDDDVLQSKSFRSFGDSLRFVELDDLSLPFRNRAESARPSADIAEDHERRRLLGPALGSVRAFSAFADGLQFQVLDDTVGVVHARLREWSLQPSR